MDRIIAIFRQAKRPYADSLALADVMAWTSSVLDAWVAAACSAPAVAQRRGASQFPQRYRSRSVPSDSQLPSNHSQGRKGRQKEGQRELKPWDPRPWPESGDDNQDVTFAAVGRALTQWARFETALSRLFAGFIAIDRDSEAARRAFGAVRTFEGRMDMIRAAATSHFSHFRDEPLKATWDDLAKRAKLLGERRNEIAHGAVSPFFPRLPTKPGQQPCGVCLMPADTDTKKRDVHGRPVFAYNSAALAHYAAEFEGLTGLPVVLTGLIAQRKVLNAS